MDRVYTRLISLIAPALLLAAWAAQASSPGLVVFPLFTQFYLREPATFVLRNESPNTVMLSNDAPWTIVDGAGRHIFSPLAMPKPVPVGPGAEITWRWNQRDDAGKQVAPGEYTAVFVGLGLRAALPISAQVGSRGFFTFMFPDGARLRVFMTDPQATRDAIENFYGLNVKSIPTGPLVDDRPDHSPYDAVELAL